MAARITNEQKRYVVKQLTLGQNYGQIQEAFPKRYHRSIHSLTIARIRKDNLASIEGAQQAIASDGAASAMVLKQKGYRLIETRLDNAIEDTTKLQEYRHQFQAGLLSEEIYKAKLALYEKLTINELVKLTESMHTQSKDEKDTPPSASDQAALAALIAGIQAGNPVQLVQITRAQASGNPVA